MVEPLSNYWAGRWIDGEGMGITLSDPVLGTSLARVTSDGLDLAAGFSFARAEGGAALRSLTYGARAAALARCATILKANREKYFATSIANSGTTKADSSADIDGAIFTLNYYARSGAVLGEGAYLLDGAAVALNKDGSFSSQHILVPSRGVALCINAFNFPAWGLWEKAAVALLSGVPVIVKPATSTALLTHQMVKDIVESGALPKGALSVLCGRSDGLLDQLTSFDHLSFTGSARTAAGLRAHDAICRLSTRVNIESDSINSALLAPGEGVDSPCFTALVREVFQEMTVKAGQKCTAIRRVFVPEAQYDAVLSALSGELSKLVVGNPRNPSVRMGSLVSRSQLSAVQEGISALGREATLAFDGSAVSIVDADPSVASIVAPHLFGLKEAAQSVLVHELEVFGPVATVVAYRDPVEALSMISRGGGSLVCSVFSSDAAFSTRTAIALAAVHGRVHVVSPAVAASHTGHGNVMPMSVHGGPGRAGGGEELGGLRGLAFFHRRCSLQLDAESLHAVRSGGVSWTF